MSVDDSFVPNVAHMGEAGLYALAVIKSSYLMVMLLFGASS